MSRVPESHLLHLIKIADTTPQERRELRAKLGSGSIRAKDEVFDRLEELIPRCRERLTRLWTAYGRSSVYLWHTNILVPFDVSQTRALVAKAIARTEQGFRTSNLTREWHEVVPDLEARKELFVGLPERDVAAEDAGPDPKPRVLRVRLEDDELDVSVRLVKSHSYVFEDEERVYRMTYDVNLSIVLTEEGRLARVFGAQHDGRTSMRTFLEWALGGEIPPRMPALREYMAPVKFSESQIRRLAARMGMPCVGMEGADAQNVVGKIGMEGKLQGVQLEALDLSDSRVRAQNAVRQDSRTYNFSYTHPQDGFVETPRAQFHFGGNHPHVGFPQRTSQAAMEHIVGLVNDEVRRG